MTTDQLHVGKLCVEAKTTITPEMRDHIARLASKARCHPSDLLRDALYLAVTGSTYAAHVANDRRNALEFEGRGLGDFSASGEVLK